MSNGTQELRPRPLANLGNTCYLNSILQPLARLKCLKKYFCEKRRVHGEGPLTAQLREYMRKQWDARKKDDTMSPRDLLAEIGAKVAKFKGRRQQDAHEVLRVILETVVEEERKRVGAKVNGPPVTVLEKMLIGMLVATIVCEECGKQSRSEEPFLDIPLPLVRKKREEKTAPKTPGTASSPSLPSTSPPPPPTPPPVPKGPPAAPAPKPPRKGLNIFGGRSNSNSNRATPPPPPKPKPKSERERTTEYTGPSYTPEGLESVEKSLAEFMRPIIFEGENAYVCDTCTKRARKDPSTEKGFVARTRAVRTVKVEEAPEVLVLFLVRFAHGSRGGLVKRSGHVEFPECMQLTGSGNIDQYQLVGLCRHGGSLHSGHYTSYVRNTTSGKWFHCNDESISSCDSTKVHKAEAYVLFYERT